MSATSEHKELIRVLREDYQLTVSRIAKALGVTDMTIYRWSKEKSIRRYNLLRLRKLASQLESGKGLSKSPLTNVSTQEMVKELSARGWRVTLEAK